MTPSQPVKAAVKGIRSGLSLYMNSFRQDSIEYTTMVQIAVILVAVAASALARPAEENHGCKTKDGSFMECFTDAGNHIFHMLPTGDKSLGLPKLDPLQVRRMPVLDNGDHMHLDLINASHSGLGHSTIHHAMADPEHYKFRLNLTTPEYTINGTYDMNAKIAMLPMQGKGDAKIVLSDVDQVWEIQGKPVTKKGKEYMEITDFKITIVPKSMEISFDNMFNGNKEMGVAMNKFLNENWQDVLKQLKPSMEKSYSQLMKTVGAKLLEKAPYKDMFPDM